MGNSPGNLYYKVKYSNNQRWYVKYLDPFSLELFNQKHLIDELDLRNLPFELLPKGFHHIKVLRMNNTYISELPNDLINLEMLYCVNTPLKKIPNTCKKLKLVYTNKKIFVPPELNVHVIINDCKCF